MELNKFNGITPSNVNVRVTYQDDRYNVQVRLEDNGDWEEYFIEANDLKLAFECAILSGIERALWHEQDKINKGFQPVAKEE